MAGDWVVGTESARAAQATAGIAYQFSVRDMQLVLGPGQTSRKVPIRVTLDGEQPGADHGSDVDADGNSVLDTTRLFQLVRQSVMVRQRRFYIRFLDGDAVAYTFTFG